MILIPGVNSGIRVLLGYLGISWVFLGYYSGIAWVLLEYLFHVFLLQIMWLISEVRLIPRVYSGIGVLLGYCLGIWPKVF